MTVISEVAKRYAGALFMSVTDKSQHPQVLDELRTIEKILSSNEDIYKFLISPLTKGEQKADFLRPALEAGKVSEEVKNLALMLAKNDRLSEWQGVVSAFESKTDEENGVVRGTVHSAAPLVPDQRTAIEKRVAQVTGKKVILEYKQDESLIGGLVAEVGSLRFDDSLQTQLRLMNEELKRRAH